MEESRIDEDKRFAVNNRNMRINDKEVFKIKLALSSLTNTVILCPMVATLYTQSSTDDETWTYAKRGVPVIILIHDANRDVTAAQLCIADPESGFSLWRECLYESSNYKASQKNFHTFKLSSDKGGMAGIKFPTDEGGNIFLQDILCSIPKGEPRSQSPISKNRFSKKKSIRKICKDEISSPCMFKHVASINGKTRDRDRSRTIGSKGKGTKYSGSGSSLDAPDADPSQSLHTRRPVNPSIKKR